MKQQVFFLHSAGSQEPHEGSSDFLKTIIKGLGSDYEVIHPVMPRADDPDYHLWKSSLLKELPKLEGDVIFIGHSLGGAVLLKYLSEETINANIKGMFLCATPFWGIDENWQSEDFTLSDDFITHLPEIPKLCLYQSEGDPVIPREHFEKYCSVFPNATSHLVQGDSHGFTEGLPRLIDDIKSIA